MVNINVLKQNIRNKCDKNHKIKPVEKVKVQGTRFELADLYRTRPSILRR